MSDSDSEKNSITEVAEESFVRERPLEIERGAVLAGRYQVEEVIGKGGSGVVLRVFDRTVQNVVALKVLKSELARDSKWDKRFSRELRLGRPIQHPNVCRIFDIGEADGHRFLTMELASGGSLRDELKRRPALERPIEDRLKDARAAVEGLAAIHATGVVHRDFKPDNLLRMEDGRLVISDFGLATDAAAAPGVTVMIGTPHYMAPEVLAGEPATARSDVWALGVVLHEIFFGRRPERKATSFDGTGRGPVRPATSLERETLELCEQCLSEASAERPADAREVSRLFSQVVERAQRPVDVRGRWLRAAAAALALVALATAAWVRAGRHRFRRPAVESKIASGGGVIGEASDWSKSASIVAKFGGAVHCLSAVGDHTVRVIWGQPREAVEVNLETGGSGPSELVSEAYRFSCPDRSPKTGQLVYAARNPAGALEIRLSDHSDGSSGVSVTSGRDPHWLGAQSTFLYSVDDLHVALFSLATMQLRLLGGGQPGRARQIGDEAVSASGDVVAITGYDERANAWVEAFRRKDEARMAEFPVPLGSRISFGWRNSELLIAGPTFAPELSIATLDLGTGLTKRVGRVPGTDLTRISRVGDRAAFVTRERSRDVWSYRHGVRERMTWDGNVLSAAISPAGDLLLGKRAGEGTYSVWLRHPDGVEEQLTHGGRDVTPAFSPDGRSWVYADYARGAIYLCERKDVCRELVVGPDLPGFPTIAPGGQRFAFVTQVGKPQLRIVGLDGKGVAEWDSLPVCGGLWSSSDHVWSVENVKGVYYWVEHNALTGESTGKRVRFLNEVSGDSSLMDCRADGAGVGSVLFRPVQAEEDERSIVWASSRERLGL